MLRFSAAGPKQNIVLNNFLSLTAAGLKKYSKNWRNMVIDIVTVYRLINTKTSLKKW